MLKYKSSALLGILIMGISSFASCVSEIPSVITFGNIGLVLSLLITSYGFSKWQP